MGNCCPCLDGDDGDGGGSKAAFQGEGRRLGTADEAAFGSGSAPSSMPIQRAADGGTAVADDQDAPPPRPTRDPDLDEEQRAKIRADRAAAAEARLKKQGGTPKKKKKPSKDEPLRGPNSRPLMQWTANG